MDPEPSTTAILVAPVDTPLTRDSILKAHEALKSHVCKTSVLTCRSLNQIASAGLEGVQFNLFSKAGCYQKIGAFRYPGARNSLERLVAAFGKEETQRKL